jgi:hypothetical protein
MILFLHEISKAALLSLSFKANATFIPKLTKTVSSISASAVPVNFQFPSANFVVSENKSRPLFLLYFSVYIVLWTLGHRCWHAVPTDRAWCL